MSVVKSFSVGNGDMFYISHNSPNFTIIDCFLSDENRDEIVKDIHSSHQGKEVTRFISTHPDEDHLAGLKFLDDNIDIRNFYCVKNAAIKLDEETEDFQHYCKLRDDASRAYYLERGVKRAWITTGNDERKTSGIEILWPVTSNPHYIEALRLAGEGESPNNISAVLRYSLEGGASVMWLGDLEKEFMENITGAIEWPKTDIIFAAHHGRDSGKIPNKILEKLQPKIIVLGEAPSRHLNYYTGYNILTQNTAGDIIFDLVAGFVHVYVGEIGYSVDYLENEYLDDTDYGYYIGSLKV